MLLPVKSLHFDCRGFEHGDIIQRIPTFKTHVFFAGIVIWTTKFHTSNQMLEFSWCHLRIDHDLVSKVKLYNGLNFKSTSLFPTLPLFSSFPSFRNYSISFLSLFLSWRDHDNTLLDIKYKIFWSQNLNFCHLC